MTDLEKFKQLFESVGLPVNESNDGAQTELYLGSGESEAVKGYSMFFVIIIFDASGKFFEFGIWE
ncbi:MAG: hypothetical protein AN484_07110 [Aphanizomenon flos-aquae WA102]|jgi:hypothetical protein|uniref:Uncharacterized protein n=1 Tax=Aphanizomenon flos-aquae WA102 TaxID=1710896 RepID=A0A1B7X516_APHFL|nr:MAG: hypothetical protein AN484_07110 [Aphanizomenon flos-aquae WA102]